MRKIEFAEVYGTIPQALEYRVQHTLAHLDAERVPATRRSLRTVVIALALTLAMGSVAYAIIENKTAALFGWFYGDGIQTELEMGDTAAMGQSLRLGDVTYTVEEMVYKYEGKQQGLYGVIRIAPAEGAGVVLVPEDYSVFDAAGYRLHYAGDDEAVPDDAPCYADLAAQNHATLLRVQASVEAVSSDGTAYANTIGQSWLPQQDGTVLGTIEITEDLPRGEQYGLDLTVSSCEITADGIELREAPEDTLLRAQWHVTVTPTKKGE